MECPPELLKKNFEKLIQCDVRLNHLSQKGSIVVDTPLFEAKLPAFGGLVQSKSFSKPENSEESVLSRVKGSNLAQLSTSTAELSDCVSAAPKIPFEDTSSPSSGTILLLWVGHFSYLSTPLTEVSCNLGSEIVVLQRSCLCFCTSDVEGISFSLIYRVKLLYLATSNFECSISLFFGVAEHLFCRFFCPFVLFLIDAQAIEVNGNFEAINTRNMTTQEQVNLHGLRKSMSVTDFVNHIGQSIAENVEHGIFGPVDGSHVQETFEDIAKHLLSDNQLTTVSDEKLLMSRVNSLCCLLQMDPQATIQSLQAGDEADTSEVTDGGGKETAPSDTTDSTAESRSIMTDVTVPEGDKKDVSSSCKQQVGMLRKDSFADLLLQLPRIASLPKSLFNISEGDA